MSIKLCPALLSSISPSAIAISICATVYISICATAYIHHRDRRMRTTCKWLPLAKANSNSDLLWHPFQGLAWSKGTAGGDWAF